MKRFLEGFTCWILMVCYSLSHADTPLSNAANNVLLPVTFISSAILKICLVLGIGFLAGAAVQYRMHRQSPTAVPISRPIWILIIGLVLIAIPIVGKYAYLLNQAAQS